MAGDYQRGFDDGFAAAVRADAGGRAVPGRGYVDDVNEAVKKISIGFDVATFDRINAISRSGGQSFAATVRILVDRALQPTLSGR